MPHAAEKQIFIFALTEAELGGAGFGKALPSMLQHHEILG